MSPGTHRTRCTVPVAASLCCGLSLLIVPAPGAQAATAISFGPAQGISVGTPPENTGVATGDVDGDGFLDIVTSNGSYDTVTVLFGEADGEFAPSQAFPSGPNPRSVALGDMDNDGYLDIVTPNGTDTVGVMRGLPGRNFAAVENYQSFSNQNSIALGDLNGDGDLDIMTTSKYAQSLMQANVLIADGSGGFEAPATYTTGEGPSDVELGDFNSDGDLDMAVSTRNGSAINLFIGNGSGGFGTAQSFPLGAGSSALALGDFNNDGDLDVAAGLDTGGVGVLLGNGAGQLGAPIIESGTGSVVGMTAADYNGDGDLDVAAANRYNSVVAVYSGDGTGELASADAITMNADPLSLATGDLNGDGRMDLASGNSNPVNTGVVFNTSAYTPRNTVAPNTGPETGGTEVTITGANFTGATNVRFGNAEATNVQVLSDTKIKAKAPAGAAGSAKVTVAAPLVTVGTSAAFTYTPTAGTPQVLPPGTVPKKLKNSGKTLVNPKKSRTVEGTPVTAKVRARLRSGTAVRGDMYCLRTIKGPQRKLTVKLSGKCATRVTVTYTAPGTATNAPFTYTKVYKTKRVR